MNRRRFFSLAAVPAVMLAPAAAAKAPEVDGQGPLFEALKAANVGPPPISAPLITSRTLMSAQWQAWFTKLYNAMRTGKAAEEPMETGWWGR